MKKILSLLTVLLGFSVIFSLSVFAEAPGRPLVEGITPTSTTNKTLKTSDHQLIRAGVGWYGKCWPNSPNTVLLEDENYWKRAKAAGLNAIRVTNWDERGYVNDASLNDTSNCTYLNDNPHGGAEYNGAWTIDGNLRHLTIMVNHAARNGMYVIITPGDAPGSYSKPYLEAFWTKAAAKFAGETHVIYEITNEPVNFNANNYDDATHPNTTGNLADIYKIMRKAAPDTPILSLTFAVAKESMNPVVTRFTQKVNEGTTGNDRPLIWSNNKDLVSFHTYNTDDMVTINALRAVYPVMNTEWSYFGDTSVKKIDGKLFHGQNLEQADLPEQGGGISWINFRAGRDDSEFVPDFYKFVNDAKFKNYFWKPSSLIDDSLSDLTKVHFSTNMQITPACSPANCNNFEGDAYRATLITGQGTGYITYKAPGVGKFKAHIYSNNNFTTGTNQTSGIKFYVSGNNVDWENINVTKSTPVATAAGWKVAYYTPTAPLPVGTEYIKVELTQTPNFANQIADMQITYWP
ncbi:hypothetical protein GC093_12760 [Paenibacillus sp. LMG 31456]|uniref:Glycoside hydrolase family 5 domain-containing protein n=1 Tax=Paenibacillus foliorum TaxID=2654974 RepID=A0A972GUK7_9BACL|nr:cellulase family glycosylhydrolase [Paenibacillus foliorum]NOU94082.1 hypothetical protein [Paenibacillus foliorum]